MKKLLFYFIFICLTKNISAQVAFWYESFGIGCNQGTLANTAIPTVSNGAWGSSALGSAPGNGFQANEWFISATEAGLSVGSCGDGCLNNVNLTNRSLHIGVASPSATMEVGATYLMTGASNTNKQVQSSVINCTTKNNIVLSFNYLGSINSTDFAEALYFDGLVWNPLGTLASSIGTCSPKGLWSSQTYTLPSSADGNPNVKVGFRWQNSMTGSGGISVAIDEITLTGTQATSINEFTPTEAIQIRFFPNPAEDKVFIESENITKIALSNCLGQVIYVSNNPISKQEIDLSSFASGIYYLKAQSQSGQRVFKIIKE